MREIRTYNGSVLVMVDYRDIDHLKVIENFDGWSTNMDEFNITNFYDVRG